MPHPPQEALGGPLPARSVKSRRSRRRRARRSSTSSRAAATRPSRPPWPLATCSAAACRTKRWANTSCRSFPTKPAPSVSIRSSINTASIRASGQLYEPVDAKTLASYREAKNGQVLEEGINEAGSISSFIAAGSAYATHGVPTIPFYIYYSMFGFQRIGDLAWLAADMRSARLPAGRHRRPDHAQWRRPSA